MWFAYFSPFSVYQQSFHPPSLLWHRQQYWNDNDERKERMSCSYVNLKTKGANVINSNPVVVDQPWTTPTLVSAAWDAGCWTGLSQPRGQPSVKGIFNHVFFSHFLALFILQLYWIEKPIIDQKIGQGGVNQVFYESNHILLHFQNAFWGLSLNSKPNLLSSEAWISHQ